MKVNALSMFSLLCVGLFSYFVSNNMPKLMMVPEIEILPISSEHCFHESRPVTISWKSRFDTVNIYSNSYPSTTGLVGAGSGSHTLYVTKMAESVILIISFEHTGGKYLREVFVPINACSRLVISTQLQSYTEAGVIYLT